MNEDALKSKLQTVAQATGFTFNEVFHRLVMERFLVRVSFSKHASHFVFKGGFLLSHYVDLGRDTRDLDFLLTKLSSEKEILEQALVEISSCETGDTFVFLLKSIQLLVHDHMNYPGFTATFSVTFGRMKENLAIDIGVGDAVSPATTALKLMHGKGRAIFEDEVSLMVYPPETILAEKLQTAVLRAGQNSRMKDYFDILTILQTLNFDSKKVTDAINATFAHRHTDLKFLPIQFTEDQIARLQKYWSGFFRDLRKKDGIPSHVRDVIFAINLELKKIGIE